MTKLSDAVRFDYIFNVDVMLQFFNACFPFFSLFFFSMPMTFDIWMKICIYIKPCHRNIRKHHKRIQLNTHTQAILTHKKPKKKKKINK